MFYKLIKLNKGPRIMKIGNRTLISHDAAKEWKDNIEEALV